MTVDLKAVRQAATTIGDQVVYTDLVKSETLSKLVDTELYFKLENQQFTASFKERGALNRLAALSSTERTRGVIAMSAGNHAQAVARHGKRMGVATTIVMPRTTPNAKIMQTRVYTPKLVLHGATYDECAEYVGQIQAEQELTLVHPFDDPLVIAGQGTIALECLDQQPELDTIVVPVGGGGLISGIAVAAKALKPSVRIVGVQTESFSALHHAYKHLEETGSSDVSLAEGIAVKRPGELTLPIITRLVDDVVTVSEGDIETAVFRLLEIEKTLAEGAGAAAFAAVTAHPEIARGKTAVIVSGGNIDMGILATVLQRGLVRLNRLMRLLIRLPDIPGSLSKLTAQLSNMDSNVVDIFHRRSFGDSTLGATVVELVVQLQGDDQKDELLARLANLHYNARIVEY